MNTVVVIIPAPMIVTIVLPVGRAAMIVVTMLVSIVAVFFPAFMFAVVVALIAIAALVAVLPRSGLGPEFLSRRTAQRPR